MFVRLTFVVSLCVLKSIFGLRDEEAFSRTVLNVETDAASRPRPRARGARGLEQAETTVTCTAGDCQNGLGSSSYGDGSHYEGEFKNGKRDGKGTLFSANGARYEGDWKAGAQDGKGTLFFTSGDRYEGDWKAGQKDGNGKLFLVSGDRYEGGWKAGQKDGNGKLVLASGDRYEGGWKAGQKNGAGTWIGADGVRKECVYYRDREKKCVKKARKTPAEKTVSQREEMSKEAEKSEENEIMKELMANRMEDDQKNLATRVIRMKAILRSFETDEPFDFFAERVGIPLPRNPDSLPPNEAMQRCSLKISAMNRQFWEKFKAYGGWSPSRRNGSSASTRHQQAFQVLQSLESFALWTVQPYMDEPAHGEAAKPGKGWGTPNLWTGFSSQCWNKDNRTTWEELLEFQTRTNSYALYPGTHFSQIFEDKAVAKLEGCPWGLQKDFWKSRSRDFVHGMLGVGIDKIHISISKKTMDGAYGLQNSVLWLYEIPALAQNYGREDATLQKAWLPTISILEMTQNCSGMGLEVAKHFRNKLENKSQPLDIHCRQCSTLRRCLDRPVPTYLFRPAEERMVLTNSEAVAPELEDVQNFTEEEKIDRLDREKKVDKSLEDSLPSVVQAVSQVSDAMKRAKDAEKKMKEIRQIWNVECNATDG